MIECKIYQILEGMIQETHASAIGLGIDVVDDDGYVLLAEKVARPVKNGD